MKCPDCGSTEGFAADARVYLDGDRDYWQMESPYVPRDVTCLECDHVAPAEAFEGLPVPERAPPCVCDDCGSPHVQVSAWLEWDARTGEYVDTGDEGPSSYAWCPDCDSETGLRYPVREAAA